MATKEAVLIFKAIDDQQNAMYDDRKNSKLFNDVGMNVS